MYIISINQNKHLMANTTYPPNTWCTFTIKVEPRTTSTPSAYLIEATTKDLDWTMDQFLRNREASSWEVVSWALIDYSPVNGQVKVLSLDQNNPSL